MKKILIVAIGLLGIGFLVWTSFNKFEKPIESVFDTFKEEDISVVSLKTDMEQLLSDKTNTSYQPAEMIYETAEGKLKKYNLELKLRGQTRREVCDFPPLKMKFSSEDLQQEGLQDYQTLKLVTHCKDGAEFEQNLLKEYLTYKMYNSLTENSFQVRLVKVGYIDANSETSAQEHYGFILENKKELADRLDARLIKSDNQPLKKIDAQQYQLFLVFQYMVGNTDWNLSNQHNIKLLRLKGTNAPVPVPYDFDFSGLVDASYAEPYPTLPIDDVKERFFQFRGKKDANFDQVFSIFKKKKAEILELCSEMEAMQETVKWDMIMYLETFFDQISETGLAIKRLSTLT